jgi:hypothetical protein
MKPRFFLLTCKSHFTASFQWTRYNTKSSVK